MRRITLSQWLILSSLSLLFLSLSAWSSGSRVIECWGFSEDHDYGASFDFRDPQLVSVSWFNGDSWSTPSGPLLKDPKKAHVFQGVIHGGDPNSRMSYVIDTKALTAIARFEKKVKSRGAADRYVVRKTMKTKTCELVDFPSWES